MTFTESEETLNPEVYSLCNEALAKLDRIKQEEKGELKDVRLETSRKKKEIVIELAERLEQLIPQADTISSTILKQLNGQISKSLIHECLPAKCKQEHRRKNAKKQKKKKQQLEKDGSNLASIVVLNPQEYQEEEEEEENKVAVMIGVNGRSYSQPEQDAEMPTTSDDSTTFTDKSFSQSSDQSQKEQEQLHKISSQLPVTSSSADRMIITEGVSIKLSNDNDEVIYPFDFLSIARTSKIT